MYGNVYAGVTVLVTGHTGFKGAWLSLYLIGLGAKVIGYALPAPTDPSLFDQTGLADQMTHLKGDIRDQERLRAILQEYRPAFIFHMAAQPLVLEAYRNPVETYDVNVMGSIKLLDAVRQTGIHTQVVMVVTDKCYKNNEWVFGYRETDALGGHDPYSASKAAMDIAVQSYRLSFFAPEKYADHGVAIASVRAGNVIGGGDWANYRIVPDAVRAFMQKAPLTVRNPQSVRPWQHVLEPLSGYLWLGAKLMLEPELYAEDWNFGPLPTEGNSVGELAQTMVKVWGEGALWVDTSNANAPHEAGLLRLNIDKVISRLGWRPVWDFEATIQHTIEWYKAARGADTEAVRRLCQQDITAYEQAARDKAIAWTS